MTMTRWLRRCVGALVTVAAAIPLVGGALIVDHRVSDNLDDFWFSSLDVTYEISRADDGTSRMLVTEHYVAEFPEYDQNRGMARGTATEWRGVPTHPALISITDGNGNPRPQSDDVEGDEFVMTSRASDYLHGRQEFIFAYELQNVIDGAGDGSNVQDLNWNVVDRDGRQPIGEVTATVVITPDLAAALTGDAECYQSSAADEVGCEIGVTGTGAEASDAGAIEPGDAMTIAVGFNPGTFAAFDDSPFATPLVWVLLSGGVAAVTGCVLRWWRHKPHQDDPGLPTVIAEFRPPEGIEPAHAGAILGDPDRGYAAQIIDQAVRGAIAIDERTKTVGKRRTKTETRLVARLVDRSLFTPLGETLAQGLYGANFTLAERAITEQSSALVTTRETLMKRVNADLSDLGVYKPRWPKPSAATVTRISIGVALAVAGAITAWLGVALLIGSGAHAFAPVLIGIVVSGLMCATVVVHRPARFTAKGAELRDHLLGLKLFVEWAEEDRIAMLQGPGTAERVGPTDLVRLYEPLLPYAIVFGLEKEWMARLSTASPDGAELSWYSGSMPYPQSSAFSGLMTSAVAAATPESTSSGSASTGGGYAGGGGGGGGTRGV